MEHESDTVFQGKLLGEESYPRRKKEINIADTIVLDNYDSRLGVIHEVKKSRAVEQAHIWQVKYYIFYLKKLGVQATGKIEYPLLKRVEAINLSDTDEKELERIIDNIHQIVNSAIPPILKKKTFCKKCAYYEFCWD